MSGEPSLPIAVSHLPAVRPSTSLEELPSQRGMLHGNATARLLLENHAIIWSVLLLMGPMGLPLLLLSPKYSVTAKVSISLAMVGVTVVLPIAATLYCTHFLVMPVLEAMETANASGGAV